jgi:DNA transformation protein
MARTSGFVEHVLELLAPVGDVRARAMFGGHGIYLDETIFAIVVEDRLYFKTDDVTRAGYEKLGSSPFTYVARGRRVALRYHEALPDALESPEFMWRHALEALGAACAREKKASFSKRLPAARALTATL